MEILLTILVFIFVIGVMILVHEWGHFIAAKKLGIEVETFSIGFGPKLFGWKRHGTEYKVSLLPVGGYVKMLAENPDEGATGDPREFLSRKRWERFLVLVMGPALNIVMAFLIWTAVLMVGVQRPEWFVSTPQVEYLQPNGPAEKVGILKGDLVKTINEREMITWEDVLYAVASNPRDDINVTVLRDDQSMEFVVEPEEDAQRGTGQIGISPAVPALVYGVEEDGAAAKAGLREGDRILEIDGIKVFGFRDIQDVVIGRSVSIDVLDALGSSWPLLDAWISLARATKMLDLEINVERSDQTFSTIVAPVFDPDLGFRRLGIAQPPMPEVTVRYDLLEAPMRAFNLCVTNTGRLFDIIGKMVTGRLSTKAVSGPVEIATISGQTAERGLIPLLELMAFISLNLGIINLLPLPVLDGGNILILAIEGVSRRDLSLKTKEWIMRVGVFLLLLLMVLVIYQDIEKLIFRLG